MVSTPISVVVKERPQSSRSIVRQRRRQRMIRQFVSNRRAVIGSILVGVVVIAAIVGPFFTVDPDATDIASRFLAPGPAHLMGTDEFGRDVFARVLYGARISLIVGAAVSVSASVIGLILGLTAAYYRRVDSLIMRICDGLMAFPDVLLALAIVAALGPSVPNLIVCMAIVFSPAAARLVRSSALIAKEQTYIEAMRALGARDARIIWRHIMPNTLSTVLVQASAFFASAIVIETALSFLGAGVPAPTASIGNMISDGRAFIYNGWWMTVFPTLALVMIVLGVNLLGDGLRDALDPTLRVTLRSQWAHMFLGRLLRPASLRTAVDEAGDIIDDK